MNLEQELRKEIQKKKKERGALAGRGLTSGPLAEAGPARPRSPPSPRSRPQRVRARTAASCRPGEPAELGRRVASMRQLGRALVGHQERPATSASVPAAKRAALLALLPTLSLARSSRSAARHRRRRSELLSLPAPASSILSATTDGSASSCRTPCSRLIALGESYLRRPLGPHGSPSPLRHFLRF